MTELSDYPTRPPRDALRKVALKGINLIFLSRGEGAEVKVLQGMKQTISRLPELQMIVEHCPKNLENAGIKSDAV